MKRKKSRNVRLNSQKTADQLYAAGFSAMQTETLIDILDDLISHNRLTRSDLGNLYMKSIASIGAMLATSTILVISLMAELIS